jgi:hypothetical protein
MAGFLFSTAGAFVLAAALAVGAVSDGLREARLALGAGAFVAAALGCALVCSLAGAGDFVDADDVASFGVIGVLGSLATPGDLGSGLFADVALAIDAFAVEIAAGFLAALDVPFVAGVPELPLIFDFAGVLVTAFGVLGADSVVFVEGSTSFGVGKACPPETAASSFGSAGLRDASPCTPDTGLPRFWAVVSFKDSFPAPASCFAAAWMGSAALGCSSVTVWGSGKSDPFIMLPKFGMFPSVSLIGGGAREDSRVSTACSGMGSLISWLFFLASFSWLTTFLRVVTVSSALSSLILKLPPRLASVLFMPSGVPLVVPKSFGTFPLGSTETNDARTLEVGRLASALILPTGERPRGSGEEAALGFSNIARRFRTPLLARFSVMAVRGTNRRQRVCSKQCSGVANLIF